MLSFTWKELLEQELIQLKESGKDSTSLDSEFQAALREGLATEELCKKLFTRCLEASVKDGYCYHEPSDLLQIQATSSPLQHQRRSLDNDTLLNKIYGAWLGRSAGCLLGKPVEGWPRRAIRSLLEQHGAYPLNNYFSNRYEPQDVESWMLEEYVQNAIEVCKAMPRDDDMDYTILALKTLEHCGRNFTTGQVAEMWLYFLPAYATYTAERIAYFNICSGIPIPETATHFNPYREWIGAQIRTDLYGYVNPGKPALAAEMAHRDASLSHVSNGIYGAMFVAAMNAACFVEDEMELIVRIGMSHIPSGSRLYEAIDYTLQIYKEEPNWEAAADRVLERFKDYNRVHTINNACIVVLALLYGDKDLEKTITRAVMLGLDTDCNGATAGSIVGILLGAKVLPPKWVKPLHDQIESYISGEGSPFISRLAYRTLQLVEA